MDFENPCQISLLDISGKIIFESQFVNNEHNNLNTTNLFSGVYILKVTSKGKTTHFKVVKN